MIRLFSIFLILAYSSVSFSLPKEEGCPASFIQKTRFQSLYQMLRTSGNSLPKSPSDTLLYSDKDFVIIPTLGSVTPLYVLFISKPLFFNFAQASTSRKYKPIPVIANILLENFNYDGDFIWFEHGATTSGMVVGSNVDHGHIHVILKPRFKLKSFQKKALSMDDRNWESVTTAKAYDNRNGQQDYLAFGDKNTAFWAYLDTPKIPQFFRRVVAELVGRGSEWNYREFHHQEFAAETVSFMKKRFRGKHNQNLFSRGEETSLCNSLRVGFSLKKSLGQYIKQSLFKYKNSYCVGSNSCQNIPLMVFKSAG